jgi:hypothetical protein
MENLRHKLIWVTVAIVVGVAGGLATNYEHSFHNVGLTLSPSLSIAVYKDQGGKAAPSYNSSSKPIARLNSSQTIKIRDGSYDAVVNDPDHEYENPVIRFVVTPATDDATINLSYTSSKLATLLASEQPAITQALEAEYPDFSANYSIATGRLYEQGNWYGAVLTPSAPTSDIVRVILQKDSDGSWDVVIDPPQISIGEPSHPNIPPNVIESVDQLDDGF